MRLVHGDVKRINLKPDEGKPDDLLQFKMTNTFC